MKWINLFGLVLQFLSFWLAAPELLGVDTLKRFEEGLIKLVSNMPSYIMGIAGAGGGALMAIGGIRIAQHHKEISENQMIAIMVAIVVISILMMSYFLFLSKRTQKWMRKKIALPLIQKIINNQETRKSALVVAAVFFTVGFLMQAFAAVLS